MLQGKGSEDMEPCLEFRNQYRWEGFRCAKEKSVQQHSTQCTPIPNFVGKTNSKGWGTASGGFKKEKVLSPDSVITEINGDKVRVHKR